MTCPEKNQPHRLRRKMSPSGAAAGRSATRPRTPGTTQGIINHPDAASACSIIKTLTALSCAVFDYGLTQTMKQDVLWHPACICVFSDSRAARKAGMRHNRAIIPPGMQNRRVCRRSLAQQQRAFTHIYHALRSFCVSASSCTTRYMSAASSLRIVSLTVTIS